MSALVVEQVGGRRLARVTQGPKGKLEIVSEVREYEGEIDKLLRNVASEPLKLRHYREEEMPDGRIQHRLMVRTCTTGDPNYLHALADAVTRKKAVIGGIPVRGYVEET